MTRSVAPESAAPIPLLGEIASNSSKNIIAGAADLPFLNTSRIAFSLSPTHFEKTSGPFIDMKLASLSVATALASMVFPHPGGPNSIIPFGGLIPILLYISGFLIGHSTASTSSDLTPSRPPTSFQ